MQRKIVLWYESRFYIWPKACHDTALGVKLRCLERITLLPVLPALLLLSLAAFLESGGDALVRKGLIAGGMPRGLWFVAGALVLFVYGVVVNLPNWDFGRMLGVYVALFFVAAQVISYFVFDQSPTLPVLVGGAFILVGGIIMTFWQGGLT